MIARESDVDPPEPVVSIVHDYLTQRGGAERVLLSLLKAFPAATLHTSLYSSDRTFSEFQNFDLVTLGINRSKLLQRNHRLAFPLLPSAFSRYKVYSDVVICSSSGWAHAVQTAGRKVTYCHSPARWLYEGQAYLGAGRPLARTALACMRPTMSRWDRAAISTSNRLLTNSRAVQERIRRAYDLEAELLPPPHTIDISAPSADVPGVEPGYFLAVSRLLPYKNVTAIVNAFDRMSGEQLVVVGTGPDESQLRKLGGRNITFLGTVSDAKLRWLYKNARALVAASYEDFGLTPLEAAAFGTPSVVLRGGGFLDTIVEGVTGVFFDRPTADAIVHAVRTSHEISWSSEEIMRHSDRFSEPRFIERIRAVVIQEGVQAQ